MELQLVNTELTESRLYRNNSMGRKLTGDQVSRMLYLHTLAVFVMAQDGRTSKFARNYAKKTTGYGNYTLFRNTATDLYALAYHVNNPDSRSLHLKDGEESLARMQFDDRLHHRMMRDIARGELELVNMYLNRLRTQLKQKDSRYGSWRREAANWSSLDRKQQQRLTNAIAQEMNRVARGSELVPELAKVGKSSTIKKVASTAAGAYVGRQAADKMGKNKNVGTGLGAIAGYWAAK